MRKDTLFLLHHLYLLLMQLALAGIQAAALFMQFALGEIPCPLCLLQRVAMFGVSFGLIRDLHGGVSPRNAGLSMLFALFLLIVSVRQVLLDIYPRPGHDYIGSAVLGLHMPVWSVLIAAALLAAYALKFALLGAVEGLAPLRRFPALAQAASALGLLVVLLCAVNFAGVILQCGLDACHTYGYRLLK
jgi:disulfide bond formation protein DsbB